MDIETAANIGEVLGGLAILITLLFGLRQMRQWNENRKYEIGRDLANHMGSPLVQRGMSVIINSLDEGFTTKDINDLSREEKNAINALMIGMNYHGLLTFHGHLSINLVASFYTSFTLIFGQKLRRVVNLMYDSVSNKLGESGDIDDVVSKPFDWLIWLLDRLDEIPAPEAPIYELYKDWKDPNSK